MNLMIITMMLIMLMKMMIKINKKMNPIKNSMNNIECGFNSKNNKKINFSMNFMYIMIIFILFDIELIFMMPMIMNMKNSVDNMKLINTFLTFMMMSTSIEIMNNKINWMT